MILKEKDGSGQERGTIKDNGNVNNESSILMLVVFYWTCRFLSYYSTMNQGPKIHLSMYCVATCLLLIVISTFLSTFLILGKNLIPRFCYFVSCAGIKDQEPQTFIIFSY